MTVALWLSLLGCLIGAGMGFYAMLNPRWASWLVRLRDDPARPGGAGEFRGTYGGLFFAAHGLGLATVAAMLQNGHFTEWPEAAGFAFGVLAVCAALWWGTSVGRLLSVALDRSGVPFNLASVGFEVVLGALIAAPLLVGGLT